MSGRIAKQRGALKIATVLGQLALVTLGAASSSELPDLGPVTKVIDYYGLASGAAFGYGFFAAGITGQYKVFFDIINKRGEIHTVTLETGDTHEADIRTGNILDHFISSNVEDPQNFQRSVMASFARTIIARYPDTERVTVRLEEFETVSMEKYRQGIRPGWRPIYQAQFTY